MVWPPAGIPNSREAIDASPESDRPRPIRLPRRRAEDAEAQRRRLIRLVSALAKDPYLANMLLLFLTPPILPAARDLRAKSDTRVFRLVHCSTGRVRKSERTVSAHEKADFSA